MFNVKLDGLLTRLVGIIALAALKMHQTAMALHDFLLVKSSFYKMAVHI